MSTILLVPVVEGFAEEASVPVLLRRLLGAQPSIRVAKPWRVSRTKIVRSGELEKILLSVPRARRGCNGILVLLDADDDCPARLRPALQARADRVA